MTKTYRANGDAYPFPPRVAPWVIFGAQQSIDRSLARGYRQGLKHGALIFLLAELAVLAAAAYLHSRVVAG